MSVAFPRCRKRPFLICPPSSRPDLAALQRSLMPVLNGLDSASSALRYYERKQEIVANNLANVSTDGFKSQRVFAKLIDGIRPVAETSPDLATGNLRETGNTLDVAVNG